MTNEINNIETEDKFAPMDLLEESVKSQIVATKIFRKDLDEILQSMKHCQSSREISLAITKLQESIMWCGMNLKRLGELSSEPQESAYPNSYNPENTIVDPTADGLKL